MDPELNEYENFKDESEEEENKCEKKCENSDEEQNQLKSCKNESDDEELENNEDIDVKEENVEENIEVTNKSESKENLQKEVSEHSLSPETGNSHHSSLKDMELEEEMPNISIKDGHLNFYRPTMMDGNTMYYSKKPSNRTIKPRRKMEKSKIKRSTARQSISVNDIWVPVTPQMLLHTLKRLRFLKLGPNKQEIISNLRLHYPVRTKFNDLARELRHKLRCAVQRGFIHQNGGHYKLNYRETRGNHLHKKQIKDFWSHYQELRPLSEPREPSPPSDYEPFAEPKS